MTLFIKTFIKDSHADFSVHQSKKEANESLDEESLVRKIDFKISGGKLYYKYDDNTWRLLK